MSQLQMERSKKLVRHHTEIPIEANTLPVSPSYNDKDSKNSIVNNQFITTGSEDISKNMSDVASSSSKERDRMIETSEEDNMSPSSPSNSIKHHKEEIIVYPSRKVKGRSTRDSHSSSDNNIKTNRFVPLA